MKQIMQVVNYSLTDDTVTLKADKMVMYNLVENLFKPMIEKHNGFIMTDLKAPERPRTTGKFSQNSHIWGHIQQIANETGNDVSDIEDYIKSRAIKRGYPYHINQLTGQIMYASMTDISTVEAGYLIDELHELAGELEIRLVENE